MSDAVDYFREHAISAMMKARSMPRGLHRNKQRAVARVYHLLAREASHGCNLHHLDDFRAAREHEAKILRTLI